MMRLGFGFRKFALATAFVSVVGGSANAQQLTSQQDLRLGLGSDASLGVAFLPVRQAAEADTGVKLSESTLLHVGVGAEAGYDSNVFFTRNNRVDSPVTRIVPFIQLTNAGRGGAVPSGLYYDLSANLVYREFLTDDERAKAQRAFNPAVTGLVEFGSNQALAVTLSDFYVRLEEPPYGPSTGNITRNYNLAALQLRWTPGGGRLQSALRYSNAVDIFENPELEYANYMAHDLMVDVSWRWLPKTATYVQLSQGYVGYFEDDPRKSNSLPFRGIVGLRGLLTEKLSLNLGLGYTNGFYRDAPNPSGWGNLATVAELTYRPTLTTQILLGYRHEFRNSPIIANFYNVDAGYLSLRQAVAARFIVGGFGRYEYRRFEGARTAAAIESARRDHVIQLGANADYFIQRWFFAGVFYVFTANRSNLSDQLPTAQGLEYDKHLLLGRLGVTY